MNQMKHPVFPVSMRIAQFYMALHKVPAAWAERFIDFAAERGFNYLNLCIYGCIRTDVFHLQPEERSYSKEEIRHIVQYAAARGIEVIPNIELFAHVQSFLDYPEMEELAELRGGRKGRFTTRKEAFCPSEPKVYDFIEAYLREVAELFPCRYINAGMDENFDLGLCEKCAARAAKEGRWKLFAQHILKVHEIICTKLNRKMMMWDDALALYPEAFELFPRDIIMLSWWYGREVPSYGHVGGPRTDFFAWHEAHGFPYIGAPATYHWQNIEAYTEYASRHNPAGMLLANWGMMTRFDSWPAMAYAAHLWKDAMTAEAAAEQTVLEFFPACNPAEREILKQYFEFGTHKNLPASPEAYANPDLSVYERHRLRFARAVQAALASAEKQPVCPAVFYEVRRAVESELLYDSLRRVLGVWSDPHQEFSDWETLRKLYKKILAADRESEDFFLREYRCPVPGAFTMRTLADMLKKILDGTTPRPEARLKICYPFRLGLGALTVSIRSQQGTWRKLGSSGGQSLYLYYDDMTPSAEYLFAAPGETAPEEVKIEYRECTGGVCGYLQWESRTGDRFPAAVLETHGKVVSPENMLADGRGYTLFGDGERLANEKLRAPWNPESHSATLIFKQETGEKKTEALCRTGQTGRTRPTIMQEMCQHA